MEMTVSLKYAPVVNICVRKWIDDEENEGEMSEYSGNSLLFVSTILFKIVYAWLLDLAAGWRK